MNKKVRYTTYIIDGTNGRETTKVFYEKELRQTNHAEVTAEKVMEKKSDQLMLKWKGFIIHFYACIHKKYIDT